MNTLQVCGPASAQSYGRSHREKLSPFVRCPSVDSWPRIVRRQDIIQHACERCVVAVEGGFRDAQASDCSALRGLPASRQAKMWRAKRPRRVETVITTGFVGCSVMCRGSAQVARPWKRPRSTAQSVSVVGRSTGYEYRLLGLLIGALPAALTRLLGANRAGVTARELNDRAFTRYADCMSTRRKRFRRREEDSDIPGG
jgi:hypothetical protein